MRHFIILVIAMLGLSCFYLPVEAGISDRQQQERSASWIVSQANSPTSLANAARISRLTYAQGRQQRLDPVLLLAVMKTESGFISKATSTKGAAGLMQVMPVVHRKRIGKRNAYRDDVSIEVGTAILKECIQKFKGHVPKALNCYSGGGGKTYNRKVMGHHASLTRYLKPTYQSAQFASLSPQAVK